MSEQEAKPGASIAAGSVKAPTKAGDEEAIPDMSLLSITDGENERGIPVVKFIDDVGAFTESFTPPASAELLIGAYTELHSKFKTYEISLTQKRTLYLLMRIFPVLWNFCMLWSQGRFKKLLSLTLLPL